MSEYSDYFAEKIVAEVESALSRSTARGELVNRLLYSFESGGKLIRARLCYDLCNLMGVHEEPATVWSSVCEVLHNASLVHDDLQDGDKYRRGRPSVWFAFGYSEAVTIGDLLLMLPYQMVSRLNCSSEVKVELIDLIAHETFTLGVGQSEELSLKRSLSAADLEERYFTVIQRKTSTLFKLPLLGSAYLAGLDKSQCVKLEKIATLLGEIFQIQDDLLDLYGDKGRNGSANDLREGKVSAVIVNIAKSGKVNPEEIRSFLSLGEKLTKQDVQDFYHWIETTEADALACQWMVDRLEQINLSAAEIEIQGFSDLITSVAQVMVHPISSLKPMIKFNRATI